MEFEPQVQLKPTPIDATKANRRRLQKIKDQANILLQMEKSC